jgi:hypothetical protein
MVKLKTYFRPYQKYKPALRKLYLIWPQQEKGFVRMTKISGNETRALCYQTFYCSNKPPFHGHTVILCYNATLPW